MLADSIAAKFSTNTEITVKYQILANFINHCFFGIRHRRRAINGSLMQKETTPLK